MDCRHVERHLVLETFRNSGGSAITVLIKRRKLGRRYQAILNLNSGQAHGLTLDLGVYVARIHPGSLAAKEGFKLWIVVPEYFFHSIPKWILVDHALCIRDESNFDYT